MTRHEAPEGRSAPALRRSSAGGAPHGTVHRGTKYVMPRCDLALQLLATATMLSGCGPARGFDGSAHDGSLDLVAEEFVLDASAAADADVPAGRDVQPIDVPRDNTLDPDASCASASAVATFELLPVDIIWMVDNSASMAPAIDQVIAGLNGFASVISSRGFDYRVVMLSLRNTSRTVTLGGSTRYAVCIPPPLAGDLLCGNNTRFFHSSIDVRSTQPLEQFLGTLGQTAGYRLGEARGGEPWRSFLRPEATKTIVVVTDDNSRFSASDFLHFPGGTNPSNSNLLPPGLLDPSWSGLFDSLTFDGIYGWGSPTDPGIRCHYADGSQPTSPGAVYTALVTGTTGVRAQICDGPSAWGPFFDSVASAVERASRVACDVAIPPPPIGTLLDPTRINVIFNGVARSLIGKVVNAAACGTSGGWYYDSDTNPTHVILCPASCDRAQSELRGAGRGLEVQFGCSTIPG